MKLVRYGLPGREKPGILDTQGRIRDLSKIIPDIEGDVLSAKGLAKLRKLKPDELPLVKGKPRLGPCIGKIGNFHIFQPLVSRDAAQLRLVDELIAMFGGRSQLPIHAQPRVMRRPGEVQRATAPTRPSSTRSC